MKNPIPHNGLFATPSSMQALEEYILLHSGAERTVAMTAALMAINLCHSLVDQHIIQQYNTQTNTH